MFRPISQVASERITGVLNTALLGSFATATACFAFAAGGKHVEAEHAPSVAAEQQSIDERNQFFSASGAFLVATIGKGAFLALRRRDP